MKNIQFITLIALILLGVNSIQLRKETAGASKSTAHLVSAEIAEPTKWQNQYHTGENIRPEIVYQPVQFRFKETEKKASIALGKVAANVHYSTVETIQVEPQSENGYFSPEIVGTPQFKELDERRKHHKKHDEKEEPKPVEEEQQAKVEEHKEENHQNIAPVETKQEEGENHTEVTQAKTESLTQGQVQNQKIPNVVHPPEHDKEYEPVQKVSHISDYSQEDLARIAAGQVRVFPIVKKADTYDTSPLIYHHVVESATTDITTAHSPLTEVKNVLWRDFTPPSAGFTDVHFHAPDGTPAALPDIIKDQQGHPMEVHANILNYPTPVDIGEVFQQSTQAVDGLTNIANSIKSREFTSSYDHAQVPNPIEDA